MKTMVEILHGVIEAQQLTIKALLLLVDGKDEDKVLYVCECGEGFEFEGQRANHKVFCVRRDEGKGGGVHGTRD